MNATREKLLREGEKNLSRDFRLDRAQMKIDKEARTIEVAFSSETPVKRWFGYEILDHKPSSVDLSRLNNSHPVLVNHNPNDQVGKVERAWVDADKMCRALLRFGKSERATEIWNDVLDGIRELVSVGYDIEKLALEQEEEGQETFRALRWLPFEISIVPIPADAKVGVGRNRSENNLTTEQENTMKRNVLLEPAPAIIGGGGGGGTTGAAPTHTPTFDAAVERKKLAKELNERNAKIIQIGEKLGRSREEINAALSDPEMTVDAYRAKVIETLSPEGLNLPEAEIGMNKKELRRYSIVRAISCLSEPGGKLDGLEAEVSQEVGKKFGRAASGFYVPQDVMMEQRAHQYKLPAGLFNADQIRALQQRGLTVGTAGDGGYLVATDLRSDSFIELLRNQMICVRLGARTLTGLVGNVDIPRQSAAGTAYTPAEAAALTASQQVLQQLQLRPKRIGATTDYTKNLLAQGSIDVENFVRGDLSTVCAIKQDHMAINGTGSGNEPTGILNLAGLSVVAIGANGGAPTWDHIVDLETQVANANADIGALAYAGSTQARGKMKRSFVVTGQTERLWMPGRMAGEGEVNGYRAVASGQVPSNLTKGTSVGVCSALIFGNWADLILAMWGGVDVVVDPYTLAKEFSVRVTVNMLSDCGARHVQSFSAIKDMTTT